MTDYGKLSDEQIAKLVGDILKLEWANLEDNYNGLCYWKNGDLWVFNPCTNPSDSYPIIYKNGISIGIYGYGEWGAGTINYQYIDGTNPLRAAMIVFLQMQENKQ